MVAKASIAPRVERRAWPGVLFWTLFVLATLTLMFLADESSVLPTRTLPLPMRLVISPLMLAVQWLLLLRFREPLTRFMRRIPLPTLLKYMLVGLFLATVLGNNFAIHFGLDRNDLHPNPFVNTVLYWGPYGGALLAIYLLRRIYAFSYQQVFWICAALGTLTEQNYIVPLSFISGNILGGLVLLFMVIPAYGVAFGSIWVIMPPEELPRGRRRLRTVGVLVFLVAMIVLFYACAIVWYGILDLVFGTHFLQLD